MRLPFIWRLTALTLIAALAVMLALLAVIARSTEQAAAARFELRAVRRVVSELIVPLDAAATTGELAARQRAIVDHVAADACIFDGAQGVRIYRSDGAPVYPAYAPPAPLDVARAVRGGGPIREAASAGDAVYLAAPTRSARAFVVAVDFASTRVLVAAPPATPFGSIAAVVSAVLAVSVGIIAAGASYELERRRRESAESFAHTLALMAEALELRDPYTAGHSQRVAAYSRALAAELGLSDREVRTIEGAALLHDIGKLGVPDPVLLKAGPLDATEWGQVAGHPILGARLLRNVESMREVIPCILHHHERFDGLGYPDRLEGERIPLGARIIAVADMFDAMTTNRPYRAATTVDDALHEIERVAASQLDARLATAFIELVRRGAIHPGQTASRSV